MVTHVACVRGIRLGVYAVRLSNCGTLRVNAMALRILMNRPTYIVSGCVAAVVSIRPCNLDEMVRWWLSLCARDKLSPAGKRE